jgi:hypothetical protein
MLRVLSYEAVIAAARETKVAEAICTAEREIAAESAKELAKQDLDRRTVGRFSFDPFTCTVTGQADYLASARYAARKAKIAGGQDAVFNYAVRNMGSDPVSAILVSLQTDFAAFEGIRPFTVPQPEAPAPKCKACGDTGLASSGLACICRYHQNKSETAPAAEVAPVPAAPEAPAAPAAEKTASDVRPLTRNEVIKQIKTDLRRRSGKSWSVTAGRGTAWGWLTISAPPARCTAHSVQKEGTSGLNCDDFEYRDTGVPGGYMTDADATELAKLLGKSEKIHCQGEKIPSGGDYYEEYLDRAAGRTPKVYGEQYWD